MDNPGEKRMQYECLEAFLNNLRQEQEALCLNDVNHLKTILSERETLFAQVLQKMEAGHLENVVDDAHRQDLAHQIEQQSVRNQYLLEKKLLFNKTFLRSLRPKEEGTMTYDGSGTRKEAVTKRVIINQEV